MAARAAGMRRANRARDRTPKYVDDTSSSWMTSVPAALSGPVMQRVRRLRCAGPSRVDEEIISFTRACLVGPRGWFEAKTQFAVVFGERFVCQ